MESELVVEDVCVVDVYVVDGSVDVDVEVEMLVKVVLYSVDGTVKVAGTVVVEVVDVVVYAVEDEVCVVVVVADVVTRLFRIDEIV